jgi:succinate dehydrogenase / fumarate reductase cytochrome b subunit
VLDTALVRVSPNAYDKVISLYKNPLVNVMELGLVGAILYHALNGLRVMLVDFWAGGVRYQRLMLWVIVAVWIVVMVPSAYFMLQYNVEKLFGSN